MSYSIECPHFSLNEISSTSYDEEFSLLRQYEFKFERIMSLDGDIIGYEILLDFELAGLQSVLNDVQYQKAIRDASAVEFIVDKLAKTELNIKCMRRFFINFERMHLCNRLLLKRISLLSKKLFLNNIEVVLEITERDVCGKCPQITHGLNFLKNAGVTLAVDDFDIYGSDFRFSEVLAGGYSYIKIEAPINNTQKKIFNDFSLSSICMGKRIILEKVENTELLKTLVAPYGVQGYAYGSLSKRSLTRVEV